jgi:hypothetical protein
MQLPSTGKGSISYPFIGEPPCSQALHHRAPFSCKDRSQLQQHESLPIHFSTLQFDGAEAIVFRSFTR